ETLAKLQRPIIWTLHDMWAFTGGCLYTQDCEGYLNSCGKCPQLNSNNSWDLSRWVWQRKKRAWKNLDLTIVTPSSWLADCARSSSLFKDLRIEFILNGIDTQVYKPFAKDLARKILNLPLNKHLILFGSLKATSDPRKGFPLLKKALQELTKSETSDNLELIVLGASQPESDSQLELKTHYLGTLRDDLSLALVYSAADVFVLPSVQDNLPNTILEAIACGTPCVAFKIGGMPDMIDHQKDGYLVQPYQTEDLAKGISWLLGDEERYQTISHLVREKAEKQFTLEIQANRYLAICEEIAQLRKLNKQKA
ncbi:MAG: glycosyltransferase, partial [Okeania sp. SIO2D1]|nr:glycosyltransferase [Okeania sp. SIO2D1]